MSAAQELKEINAQKKKLADEAKALREKLDETKEERKGARKVQAEARTSVRSQKADLRDLSAKVYSAFSESPAEEIDRLADEIMEVASELAGTVRKFAAAKAELENI